MAPSKIDSHRRQSLRGTGLAGILTNCVRFSLSKYLRFPRAGPAYGETSSYFLKAPVKNVTLYTPHAVVLGGGAAAPAPRAAAHGRHAHLGGARPRRWPTSTSSSRRGRRSRPTALRGVRRSTAGCSLQAARDVQRPTTPTAASTRRWRRCAGRRCSEGGLEPTGSVENVRPICALIPHRTRTHVCSSGAQGPASTDASVRALDRVVAVWLG